MPIYEYRCSLCGHELEALQKLSEPALVTCPSCKQDSLTKLISAAGFQLKGTGWYATDFRSSGAKPAAKDGAKDGAKPASSDGDTKSGKTDAATDSKSPSATTTATPATPAASSTGSATGGSSTPTTST